jgi:hypothetical protein
MDYTVNVRPYGTKNPVLIINTNLSESLNLTKKKRAFVSFGTQRSFVDIHISDKLDDVDIYLSNSIIKDLHLPDYTMFEVAVKGNEIMLGPCIGILVSDKYEDITKRRLKEIYLSNDVYSKIHGAIIAFSLDKVNKSRRLIEGYCYNPEKGFWDVGIFPYPLSIYRKTGLSDEWENHFLSAIGDTVFNNYSFGKWDMYRWFSREEGISSNLPETRIYRHEQDIVNMLEEYGMVYAKPIWGMKGYGVIRITKNEGNVIFRYRDNDENKEIAVESPDMLHSIIEELFKPGGHIIQQGLDLISHDGGIVDFRCVMQKNELGKWICNGMIARMGAEESVVSNISSGGSAMPAQDLINEALNMSECEKKALQESMICLCNKICSTLDGYGFNFGTLGLDLGLDKNMKIWIIEINNRRPHPAIALRGGDVPAFYTILAEPLYYAKGLAGFGAKEE